MAAVWLAVAVLAFFVQTSAFQVGISHHTVKAHRSASFVSRHAHKKVSHLNLRRHGRVASGKSLLVMHEELDLDGTSTAQRSSVQFSSLPKVPETMRAGSSLCRGRGSKGSLYFAKGWTIHSAHHGWEEQCSQISDFYSKKVKASSEFVRYKTKMILGGFVVMLASFPAVALLVKPVAGLHLVAKMFANAVAGMAAITIFHPMESMQAGGESTKVRHLFRGIGDALASQIVLRSMSILSYTYFLHGLSWFAFSASCYGLVGVALASLATGVVMGLVSAPLEAAESIEGGEKLPQKLKRLAAQGAFTETGFYGGLLDSLVVNVVGFEAFFVSFEILALAWPAFFQGWMGTAIGGGIAGIVSAAAVSIIDGMRKVESIRERFKDWWRGRKCIRSDVQDVVDECYTAAGFNSVLFVSYKAVLQSLLAAV